MQTRMPRAEVAAVGVVAHLAAVAQDVQRVLSLEHLLHQVGHDVAHRELHVAAQDLRVAESARVSPMPTQLNGRAIVYGSLYCSYAPWAKYSSPVSGSRRSNAAAGSAAGRLPAWETRSHSRRPSSEEITVIFCSLPLR